MTKTGLVVALTSHHDAAGWVVPLLGTGFLGGYTTFSAMTLDTYTLIERGRDSTAFAYSAGSVLAGLGALVAGIRLGRGA